MAIASSPVVVLDCPDPSVLANFYADLLGWTVSENDDWWTASGPGGHFDFQRVEDFVAPEWPGQEKPQQMHIDVVVDDLDVAEQAVIELGATKHENQPGTSFRVFLDPAGHPFCLCSN